MKKRLIYCLQILVIVSIGIIAGVLLSEIGCSIWYYYEHQQFIYSRFLKNKLTILTDEQRSDKQDKTKEAIYERKLINQIFHPYWGMTQETLNPDFPRIFHWQLNHQGIDSPTKLKYGYPIIKKHEEDYIIGIFGGSVAANIVSNKAYGEQVGGGSLVKSLRRSTFFKDRHFILIDFGEGAHKQPQQLLKLNFLLALGQQFDLVLNVDGFNEVALGNSNNVAGMDFSLPAAQALYPLIDLLDSSEVSAKRLTALARLVSYKEQLRITQLKLHQTRFALKYVILSLYVHWLETQISNQRIGIDMSAQKVPQSFFVLKFRDIYSDQQELYNAIVQVWANASLAIYHQILNKETKYVHVIQPNQYYDRGRKKFSPEEAKIALGLSNDHPYVPGVLHGYPLLLKSMDSLQKQGVPIFSATDIFLEEHEMMYRDACCHYTRAGQDIFNQFIADCIIKIVEED